MDKHPVKALALSDVLSVPRITFSISQGKNESVFCLYGSKYTQDQVGSPIGHKYFPTGQIADQYLPLRKGLRSYDAKAVQALVQALEGKGGHNTILKYGDGFKRLCLDDDVQREALLTFLDNACERILHPRRYNGTDLRSKVSTVRNKVAVVLERTLH